MASSPVSFRDATHVYGARGPQAHLCARLRDLHEEDANLDALDVEEVIDDLERVPGHGVVEPQEIQVDGSPDETPVMLQLQLRHQQAEETHLPVRDLTVGLAPDALWIDAGVEQLR